MSTRGKILIVEDEESIINVLTSILSANDYSPVVAKTGEQALMLASSHLPDVVLLDLGLPGIDGTEVLKELRKWYYNPVLVVSARDKEAEKVEALDLGADDYITKPFGTSELLARIRAVIRNSGKRLNGKEITTVSYGVGEFLMDFDKHMVSIGGVHVHLTQIEYKIVEFLARNPGSVLSYDMILQHVWGSYIPDNNKILRVNMANIRRKLETNPAMPKYILTEIGIGYRMAEEEDL
jgi:two-component system KDP operon response regulator KdpE